MSKQNVDTLVSLRSVSKEYRAGTTTLLALNNVNINVQKGEFTVLAGASGSGKTTLLNVIGCLDAPTEGEVSVCGRNIMNMSDAERSDFRLTSLGFVFQAYNLIPVLSARENVEFPLVLMNYSAREAKSLALHMLDQLGIGELAEKRPNQMSGGQQQRVAVARALVHKPSIVLADEPTANLDSTNSEQLIQLMRTMNEQDGTTFIFASHDDRVIRQAKRTIIMEDGAIVSDTNN